MYTLELRDAANSQLTITLPAQLIEDYIMPTAIPLNSAIALNDDYNYYLFPFCSNLLRVLETGENLGGYSLSGQERVLFQPLANLTGRKVSVISYEYAVMAVRGGTVKIERRS